MHLHCDVCIYYYQCGGFPRHVAFEYELLIPQLGLPDVHPYQFPTNA
jgi:hypothetical protein